MVVETPRRSVWERLCLVVEISDAWGTILRERLEQLGLQVSRCRRFEEAIELLQARQFDLVIQDLSLDEEKQYHRGFDLLRYLHGKEYPHQTPVIVVSGTAEIEHAVEILNSYPRVIHFAQKQYFYNTVVSREFSVAVLSSLDLPPWKSAHLSRERPKVFVSKSFDPADSEINDSLEEILESVGLDIRSGEHYSDEAIPDKIRRLIRECDALVAIFVGDRSDGRSTTIPPPWIVREVEFANSIGRQTILLSEHRVQNPWASERELIPFDRSEITKLSPAAARLLEALATHRLIS